MLSCRDVTRLVASDLLASVGWRQRLAVRAHQAICRHCRRYARQLGAIGDTAREWHAEAGSSGPVAEVPARVRAAIEAAAPPRDD